MSLNERKFLFSRIILAAVFIWLSGETNGEPRRCYWCGPLAEQVHRSQRAPACTGPREVTDCDLGYTHCAIVATAPPYMESRYCVKIYQDECYPLFCNSTRTWRMTCPCRGDLCNGHKTDRELEAFKVLAKLVGTTHNTRIKRTIATAHIINEDTNIDDKKSIDVSKTNDTVNSVETADIDTNIVSKTNSINSLMETEDQVMKESALNDTNTLTYEVLTGVPEPDNDIIVSTDVVETQEVIIQQPIVAIINAKSNEIESKSMIKNDYPASNIESNYPRTEIIILGSETTDSNMINTPTNSPVNLQTTQPTTSESTKPMVESMKPMVESTKPVIDSMKPMVESTKPMVESMTPMVETTTTVENNIDLANLASNGKDILPPAEALQHTEMPAVKTTEATRITITSTRPTHKVESTQRTMPLTTEKPKNSTAIKVDANLILLFVGIILH